MKTKYFFILATIFLMSCTTEEEPSLAYYQIQPQDNNFIIYNQQEGQEFIFKNQNGDAKTIMLKKINRFQHQLYTVNAGLFSVNNYFYYDSYQLVYYFLDSMTQYYFTLDWRRWPLDYEKAIHDINTTYPSKLDVYIPFFRYLNPEVSNENWNLRVDITKAPVSMEVDGVHYNRVYIVNRNTTLNGAVYEPALYLDLSYGIIGFDDQEGNLWRLTHQNTKN